MQQATVAMPAAAPVPQAQQLLGCSPAEADLHSRQQRLSSIASAARAEVESLRADRAYLTAQLRRLCGAVAALPAPPRALTEAHASALRAIADDADAQGARRPHRMLGVVTACSS